MGHFLNPKSKFSNFSFNLFIRFIRLYLLRAIKTLMKVTVLDGKSLYAQN